MNEFNSQVCTSVEQSKRLLAMGLKPETADMCHFCSTNDYIENPYTRMVVEDYIDIPLADNNKDVIPAWSLHRLIEMCNKAQFGVTISIYNDEVTVDGDLFEVFDNTYDNLILVIEFLIKGGHFNKEYFKQ